LSENNEPGQDTKRKKVMTERALQANRNNGSKSEGPINKTRNESSLPPNYKHGILATTPVFPLIESQEEYDILVNELKADLRPYGSLETSLVEKIANILWKTKRLNNFEASTIKQQIEQVPDKATKGWQSWYEALFKNPETFIDKDKTRFELLTQEYNVAKQGIEAFERFEGWEDDKALPYDDPCLIIGSILEYEYWVRKQDNLELPDTADDLFDVDKIVPGFWSSDDIDITPKVVKEIINQLVLEFGKDYEELFAGGMEISKEFLRLSEKEYKTVISNIEFYSNQIIETHSINNNNIMRMETHLNKLFLQTLHELQRMQGMRIGISKPPEAIDFTGLDDND